MGVREPSQDSVRPWLTRPSFSVVSPALKSRAGPSERGWTSWPTTTTVISLRFNKDSQSSLEWLANLLSLSNILRTLKLWALFRDSRPVSSHGCEALSWPTSDV